MNSKLFLANVKHQYDMNRLKYLDNPVALSGIQPLGFVIGFSLSVNKS